MMTNLRHQFVTSLKRVIYRRRGEPNPFAGQLLRYVPGTRPIRLRYLHSENWVNRYDALQVVWLRDHLRKGDTAVDVGVHYSIYSILMTASAEKQLSLHWAVSVAPSAWNTGRPSWRFPHSDSRGTLAPPVLSVMV